MVWPGQARPRACWRGVLFARRHKMCPVLCTRAHCALGLHRISPPHHRLAFNGTQLLTGPSPGSIDNACNKPSPARPAAGCILQHPAARHGREATTPVALPEFAPLASPCRARIPWGARNCWVKRAKRWSATLTVSQHDCNSNDKRTAALAWCKGPTAQVSSNQASMRAQAASSTCPCHACAIMSGHRRQPAPRP